jgi:hypothetical protein
MNRAVLGGLLGGLGGQGGDAVLDPGPDRCCVAIRAPR